MGSEMCIRDSFYTDNLDPSISGLGNKMSGVLKAYKETMRGLKRRHRTAYKVGKWTLHIALVALLFRAVI